MKLLVICICVVGALAIPAVATGGAVVFPTDNDYQGRIEGDPNTYFGFDVVRQSGKRKVKHVLAQPPYNCYSGGNHGYALAEIPGSFRIRHGRFHGTREFAYDNLYQPSPPLATFKLSGRLLRHGKARGTVGFRAYPVGPGDTCYSGTLAWNAKRGAVVTPNP